MSQVSTPNYTHFNFINFTFTVRHRNKAFSVVAQKTLRPTFCLPTVTTGENFSARIVPG